MARQTQAVMMPTQVTHTEMLTALEIPKRTGGPMTTTVANDGNTTGHNDNVPTGHGSQDGGSNDDEAPAGGSGNMGTSGNGPTSGDPDPSDHDSDSDDDDRSDDEDQDPDPDPLSGTTLKDLLLDRLYGQIVTQYPDEALRLVNLVDCIWTKQLAKATVTDLSLLAVTPMRTQLWTKAIHDDAETFYASNFGDTYKNPMTERAQQFEAFTFYVTHLPIGFGLYARQCRSEGLSIDHYRPGKDEYLIAQWEQSCERLRLKRDAQKQRQLWHKETQEKAEIQAKLDKAKRALAGRTSVAQDVLQGNNDDARPDDPNATTTPSGQVETTTLTPAPNVLWPLMSPPDGITHLHGHWVKRYDGRPIWQQYPKPLGWDELPDNITRLAITEHWQKRYLPDRTYIDENNDEIKPDHPRYPGFQPRKPSPTPDVSATKGGNASASVL